MDPNHSTLITSPPSSPGASRARSGSTSTVSSIRFSPHPTSPQPVVVPTNSDNAERDHIRAASNTSSHAGGRHLAASIKVDLTVTSSPTNLVDSVGDVQGEEDNDKTPMRTQVSTPVHSAIPDSNLASKQLSATAAKFEPKSIGLSVASKDKDQQQQQEEIQKLEAKTTGGSSIQPPNVYINGLPPHFPEDQLYALTSPYGPVRSVRSFTRHIGDRASGYGFVLFESMTSAQRCIEGLKKFKNLHPSLSKQVHKIPGTVYFHAPALTPSASGASLESCESTDSASSDADESFKQRMARLGDTSSTNLYIEGLPLSTDEPTLAALMSPYIIKSSRLFQTKLSDPPRIIAFVRLETRQAAEEIIERLHGRMVRGWNDPGSRISVRFADTAEQRELRRTERQVREGEQSPARLTIAQAALLNLHGGDLRRPSSSPSVRRHPAPLITTSLPLIPPSRSMSPLSAAPHFQTGLPSQFSSMPNLHGRTNNLNGQEILDLTLTSNHPQAGKYEVIGSGGRSSPLAVELSQQRVALQRKQQHLLEQQALLDEERRCFLATRDQALLNDLRRNGTPFNSMANSAYSGRMLLNDDAIAALGPPAATRARNGYTPAEELLLLAHRNQRGSLFGAQSTSENDFHSGASFSGPGFAQHSGAFSSNSAAQRPQPRHYTPSHSHSSNKLDASLHQSQQSIASSRHSQSQPSVSGLNVTPSNQAHLRSTTLPQQRTQPAAGAKHHQHSSMSISIPNQQRNNTTARQSSNKNQHAAPTSMSNEAVTNNKSNNISNKQTGYDSPLVSPALTYSSSASRTPASLSPATPFFSSFPSGEGFGEQVQQNQKQNQVDESIPVVQVDSRD